MFWINLLKKLIKALNENASPAQLAGGAVFGTFLGLCPGFGLHKIAVIILVIIINVNISMVIFSSALFGIIGFALDPVFHAIGKQLLLKDSLEKLWASLYNMPVVPFTKFNNTVMLGSLVVCIIIALPVFLFFKQFVIVYRSKIKDKLEKFRIVKFFKATGIYSIYQRYKS